MVVAADIMTRPVVTVSPETPVRTVADVLASHRFGSVPVIDAEAHLLGLVTEEDMVMRAVEIHLPRHITFLGSVIYLENPERFREEAEKILALTASDIMDTRYPTARPDESVSTLATRMLEGDLRRVLVLDEQSRLQGIITRADIIRMQIRGDQLPDRQA